MRKVPPGLRDRGVFHFVVYFITTIDFFRTFVELIFVNNLDTVLFRTFQTFFQCNDHIIAFLFCGSIVP